MEDIKVRLKERLQELLPDNWREILDLLYESTVLCGGLVLQVMTGKKWDTDIDIFTTNKNLVSFGKGNFVMNSTLKRGYLRIPGILNIFSGKITETKIDIIHITSIDEVFTGFDFDFCKVWYDGSSFHAAVPDSVRTLSCIVPTYDFIRTRKAEERIPKYRERGFQINLD